MYGRVVAGPETLARQSPGRFDGAVPDPARGAVAASNLATAGSETHEPTAVAWEDGVITDVGPAEDLAGIAPEWFEGCTIAPGFVDCHTHLPSPDGVRTSSRHA